MSRVYTAHCNENMLAWSQRLGFTLHTAMKTCLSQRHAHMHTLNTSVIEHEHYINGISIYYPVCSVHAQLHKHLV